MTLPTVEHPTLVIVNGRRYRVVAHCSLTDDQAAKAVRIALRSQKHAPGVAGTITTIVTAYTERTRHTLV